MTNPQIVLPLLTILCYVMAAINIVGEWFNVAAALAAFAAGSYALRAWVRWYW